MLNMDMIFDIGFIALFAICMLIGLFKGIKQGLFPALVRLGMILFCFLIAIPLTNLVCSLLSGYAPELMQALLGNTADQIASYSPSTMELLRQFPLALIAPILFIVIFFLLKLIAMIVFRFLKLLLPKSESSLFRALSGMAGVLTSLICLLAVCLPLWGLIGICHQTIQTVADIEIKENQQLSSTISQIDAVDDISTAPAVNNFVAELFTNGGNNALYNGITKLHVHGETVLLGEELHLITHTAADTVVLIGSLPDQFALTDLNEEQISALRTIAADIDSSELLKNIFSEWVSAAARTWKNGEALFGIEDPAANTAIKPVIHSLYGFLATTNSDLLVSDINLFIDILDVLMRHEVLTAQQTALLEKFGNNTFMNDLTAPLSEHDRIRTSLSELTASTTGAWANGTDYMGLSEPQMSTEYRAILRAGYGFLATTNESVFIEDLKMLSDLASMLSKISHSTNILLDDGFLEQFNIFLGEHIRFRDYFADWIAKVANAWANNKDFDGMLRPATNELIDPVMISLLDILSTTNKTLIHDDLSAMADVMRVLRTYDVFGSVSGGSQMGSILMNSEFVSDMNEIIRCHERFKPMLDIVASLGLSAISSQLTIALPESEMMTSLSGSISTTLNEVSGKDKTAKLDAIEVEVSKVLTENKVNVPEGVTGMISQIVHDQFGDLTNVTEKDVTDYLTGLYNSTDNLDGFFH